MEIAFWWFSFESNSHYLGIVYLSPYGDYFEASCCLEYLAQIIRPNMKFAIRAIGATYIEASSDSLWVVQYMFNVYQCFHESLVIYLGTCLDVIFILNCFIIAHIFRHENWRATSWLNKHQATMLLMVYPIFHKSRWFVLPTSVRPDWSSLLRPLMNNLV
jgi:hypothetical protein